MGNKFLMKANWNAGHTDWRSKCPTAKGKNLFRVVINKYYSYISIGEPTYWLIGTRRTKRRWQLTYSPTDKNLFRKKTKKMNYKLRDIQPSSRA